MPTNLSNDHLSNDQKLVAADQLWRDYQVLANEKEALLAWLDHKLDAADSHLDSTDDFQESFRTRQVKHGFFEMRADTERQLERYREYMDGLRHRQRQLAGEDTP